MELVEVIKIFKQVGDIKVRVWVGVVDGLEVSAIFRTEFIEKFIRAILPEERRIFPVQ